jgi:hypothetical protein
MSDVEQRVAGNLSAGGTCDSVCQAEGFSCNPGCGEPGKTHAGRSVHVDENGAGPEREIPDCSTNVPPETIESGFPVELGLFECCCVGPWWTRVTEINADASSGATCASLCEAEGLVCDDQHQWGLDETGGAWVNYVDGAVTRVLYLSCDALPGPTFSDNGRTYDLGSYRCACHPEPPEGQPEPPAQMPMMQPSGITPLYGPCSVDGECEVGLFCEEAGYCTRSCMDAFGCPPPGSCNLVQQFCALE